MPSGYLPRVFGVDAPPMTGDVTAGANTELPPKELSTAGLRLNSPVAALGACDKFGSLPAVARKGFVGVAWPAAFNGNLVWLPWLCLADLKGDW